MKLIVNLPIEAGLYTEQSARGAQGRWKDADKVRFRYGLPEKIGGWERLEPQFRGLARRIHDWASLDGRLWTAIGTDKKLYLWQNGVLSDITPLRLSTGLMDPFTTVTGSTSVVVTHLSGHGAQRGDFVRFAGSSPVGGLDLNGEFEILQILNFEQYRIEADVAASGSATGGGATSVEYDISIGGADTSQGFGWGVGGWGESTWGTARTRSSTQIPARTWSLDNWGEDLIANPNGKSIYWWNRTNGPGNRALLLEGAPARCIYSIISQRDRQLFALGCVDYVTGVFDPLLIRYCSRENFNDWLPTENNTAGDLRLYRGSKIVCGIRTRGELLVFTDVSVHGINYLGEGLLYGISVVGENVSILGPNAAVAVDHRVFFMAEADFYLYDGMLRVIPCPVRNHVFDRLDNSQRVKVYAGLNREFNEIWWFYPSLPAAVEPPPPPEPEPEPPPYVFSVDDPVIIPSGIDDTQYPNSNVVIRDIAYGNGMFVAVATQGKYAYSADGGATWQEGAQLNTTPHEMTGVAYGNGRFIAIGQTGLTRISTDGINWTNGPTVANLNGGKITFSEGEFIAGGISMSGEIFRSTDGTSWIASTMPVASSVGLPQKKNGRYVAKNGSNLYWSDDFAIWTLGTNAFIALFLAWDEHTEQFLANDGSTLYGSADGAVWEAIGPVSGNVVPSGTGYYISFVSTALRYSTDLVNWTLFNGAYSTFQVARFLNGDFWAVGDQEQIVRVTNGVIPQQLEWSPAVYEATHQVGFAPASWAVSNNAGVNGFVIGAGSLHLDPNYPFTTIDEIANYLGPKPATPEDWVYQTRIRFTSFDNVLFDYNFGVVIGAPPGGVNVNPATGIQVRLQYKSDNDFPPRQLRVFAAGGNSFQSPILQSANAAAGVEETVLLTVRMIAGRLSVWVDGDRLLSGFDPGDYDATHGTAFSVFFYASVGGGDITGDIVEFTDMSWGPAEVVAAEPEVILGEVTDYVCLNIEENTWTYGTLDRTAWADASPVLQKPYAAGSDGYLYKHEVGVDANGAPMVTYIESYDMEIPEAGEMLSHLDQLIPDFLTLDGDVQLSLKGKKYPHQPDYQVKGPYLVNETVEKVSTRIRARQVALRIESDGLGVEWRLATIRGRVRAHGKR